MPVKKPCPACQKLYAVNADGDVRYHFKCGEPETERGLAEKTVAQRARVAEARRLLLAGELERGQIAEAAGLAPATVTAIRKRLGLPLHKYRPSLQQMIVFDLFERGVRRPDVHRQLGMSRQRVHQHWQAWQAWRQTAAARSSKGSNDVGSDSCAKTRL